MELARSLEAKHLRGFSDSMLVVKHFSREYEQREPRTKAYTTKLRENSLVFESFELSQIRRENNSRADALSRLASAEKMPSIKQKYCLEIHQGENWMTPIWNYLEKGILPLNRKEAQMIKYRETSYTTISETLYLRLATQPLLRCLNLETQLQALEAVHEAICGEHLIGRSLAFKILRREFFWPTLRADACEYAKRCKQCQLFATVLK
ncbi:uncharacterized protein LOC141685394 [Apium graveolens]|uniref:uncharacterized protein LOC141685394 n=1 Tax=Apium graveolens TaxID=4045 RepID=UPI003D792A15